MSKYTRLHAVFMVLFDTLRLELSRPKAFILSKQMVTFFLILSSFIGFGQRKIDKTITFSTQTGSISDADKINIPFDEAFYITGTFTKRDVSSVQLKYKIRGFCKPPISQKKVSTFGNHNGISKCDTYRKREHYYLLENSYPMDSDGYIILPKVKVNANKTFEILMDPMHDNEIYLLEFTFFEKVNLDDKVQKKLKQEILVEINETYDPKKDSISNDDFIELNKELGRIVSKKVKSGKLYNKANEPIDLDKQISENVEIDNIFKKAVTKNNNLYDTYKQLQYQSNVNGFSINQLMNSLHQERAIILEAITSVLEKEEFEKKIKKPTNSIIDEKVSLESMLSFISDDLNRWPSTSFRNPNSRISNSYILEILMGRGKIVGNIIKSTNRTYDLKSGQILLSTFINLQNIKYSGKSNVIKKEALSSIISNLEKWCEHIGKLDQDTITINNLANDFQDLYTNVYTQYKMVLPVSTIENIETEKSNYLGFDVGLMVAPDIGSTFFFQGVNFHARPVNRHTRFSRLKYDDSVWKRLSFFLGVAQRIGSYENDGYKSLIGVGSPFVGAGWRIHKGFRLNGGAIWYKVENQHPLITKNSVKATYFLSLSIDASFKDIIKTMAGI